MSRKSEQPWEEISALIGQDDAADALERYLDTIEAGDLVDNLKVALALWWESTGHPAPSDLEVKAVGEREGGTSLNIGLTPQAEILPKGGRVEFTFDW